MSTPTQQKIYNYIEAHLGEHGYSPSLQEIAIGIGISPKSISLVSRSIHALVDAGKLKFARKGYRNLQLVSEPTTSLPLIGRIAAGNPIEAIEDQEQLDLGALLADKDHFVLLVKGDSMVDEGILDGDYVICKSASQVKEGEIAIALIDQQEATLKRISYQIKEHITLIPANHTMKPKAYSPHRVTFQGVFIGLLRLK